MAWGIGPQLGKDRLDAILDRLNAMEKKLDRLQIIESHLLDLLVPQRKAFMKKLPVK